MNEIGVGDENNTVENFIHKKRQVVRLETFEETVFRLESRLDRFSP